MKINLLKKALAFTIVLSMIMSTFVMVDAATIGSTTWSKDFEGMSDASYNSYLNPDDTELDCSFYGATTSVLKIKDDTDTTHGKVMHIEVDPTDTTQRFVMFQIPLISSGKFMLEFDAKTTGPKMQFTANETGQSGWNQVVTMDGNSITCGSTSFATYTTNEWKTFRVLFDVDNKKITAYVDGKSATKTSVYATTQAMKFIVSPGTGGVYFDNFKLYPVSGTAAEMNVLADGEVIGRFVDPDVSALTLAITGDSYFAAVPEITMTNLGTDILSDADDKVMSINAVYNDREINVTLNDNLIEGSKYRISIPEGTTDMFGRVISNTNLEFYAAADNGWITTKSYEEDFNVESVSTDAKPGTSGAVGWVSKGTIELLTDSSYSAGKAIKLGGATQFELSHFGGFMKKGRVHLKTQVDMGIGTYFKYDTGQYAAINLFFGQMYDLDKDSVADETIDFQYQAPSNYPNTLWDSRKLKGNGLEVIDYTLDIDNLKSYITYNGESFTLDAPHVTGTSTDLVNIGFQNIRIFQNSAADPMIIDYINWSHEYLPATVKEIKATSVTEGGVDTSSKLVITFSEAMTEDTLSNITVSDGTSDAAYTGVWDTTANTYTLTFDSELNNETKYTVTVPNTVTDFASLPAYAAYGTFTTAPIPPMDVENLAAVRNEAEISVTADVVNPAAGEVYLVVAGYKGNEMKTIDYVPVDITESTIKVEHTFTLSETDVDTVKAFALTDMDTISPYCAAAIAGTAE